jgi:hypothetical protein
MRRIRNLAALLLAVVGIGGCDATDATPDAEVRDAAFIDAGSDASTRPRDASVDAQVVGDAGRPLDAGPVDASTDAGPATADAGMDGGAAPVDGSLDASTDGGEPGCPPLAMRGIVDVPAGVLPAELSRWTCDNVYVLNGIVFVHSGDPAAPQVLEIEAGTVVRGQTSAADRGFLVVTVSGRIEANGTADEPIVFTSANPAGTRARDDWGGITLLGTATAGGARRAEGFPSTISGVSIDPFLVYGPVPSGADGGVPMTDDAHDCGTLRYVRVEFASFNAGGGSGNESNGIQIYSCGWETEIDHVQVHRSGDDGVEIFGGTADLSHLLITGASDDGFDWDDGWRGRAQFVIAQQYGDTADLGFEAGGSSETPAVTPRPRLFNFTLVGAATAGNIGGRLRGASEGTLRNFIFLGFRNGFLDVGGATTAANARAVPPILSVRNSIFWQGTSSATWPTGTFDVLDGDLDEATFFTDAAQQNQVVDPMLADPFDLTAPSFQPTGTVTSAVAAEAPSELDGELRPPFFDTTADFVGAVDPSGADWTIGWTDFPES